MIHKLFQEEEQQHGSDLFSDSEKRSLPFGGTSTVYARQGSFRMSVSQSRILLQINSTTLFPWWRQKCVRPEVTVHTKFAAPKCCELRMSSKIIPRHIKIIAQLWRALTGWVIFSEQKKKHQLIRILNENPFPKGGTISDNKSFQNFMPVLNLYKSG